MARVWGRTAWSRGTVAVAAPNGWTMAAGSIDEISRTASRYPRLRAPRSVDDCGEPGKAAPTPAEHSRAAGTSEACNGAAGEPMASEITGSAVAPEGLVKLASPTGPAAHHRDIK